MKKILLVFFSIIFIITVNANSGPGVYTGDQNSILVAKEDTNISILHETLNYYIYGTNANDKYANVTVRYLMKNNGEEETLTAVFPRKVNFTSESFTILFNGVSIENELIIIGGDDASFEHVLKRINAIEKNSEEVTCSVRYDLEGCVAANVFEITVPAEGVHELIVKYTEQPTEVQTSPYGSKIHFEGIFTYYLEPASYWKSFEKLDIFISVSKGLKISGLDDFEKSKSGGRTLYQMKYEELPSNDLIFRVYSPNILAIVMISLTSIIIFYLYFKSHYVDKEMNIKAIYIIDQITGWTLRIAGLTLVTEMGSYNIASFIGVSIMGIYLFHGTYFKNKDGVYMVLDSFIKVTGMLVIYMFVYTQV